MKGLIPQHFIDELLSRLDITEVVDRRVPLKKSGRNYMACCPFHEEKSPSFSVNQEKQFYYCFGCGASGNAIGFIMEYERLDFPQAVEAMASAAGMEVPREQLSDREIAKEQRRRSLYSRLEEIAQWYRQQLKPGSAAQNYLNQRGLTADICERFGIGYAPDNWDALLKHFAKDDKDRRQLIEGGMLIEKEDGRCYDRFRDRIMFPIRDNRGRCIAFGGRVLGDGKPKYLNSPETPVFSKGRELYGFYEARQALRDLPRLLFVEGYMDAVTLAQYGVPYAVATLGTATSADHLRSAFRHTSEVVFCFDGDEAGSRAAQRALQAVLPQMEDGRSARFLFLPAGEDPDSLIRSQGTERFTALIKTATPLEDYLFSSLGDDANAGSLSSRALLSKRAAPLIQQIPDGVYQRLMLDELARRANIGRDDLNRVLEQHPAPPPETAQAAKPDQRPPRPPTSGERDSLLEAVACLINYPTHAALVSEYAVPELARHSTGQTLLSLSALIRESGQPSTASLLGMLMTRPEKKTVDQSLALSVGTADSDTAANVIRDSLRHFSRKLEDNSLQNSVDKLRNANYAEIDRGAVEELQRQLSDKHRSKP